MSREPFENGFAALFADRFAPLHRYLSRLIGDAALAEDIAQECFVRLYQRGAMPDDPPAWLATVAHNLLRDDRRRGARRDRLHRRQANDVPAATATEGDTELLAAERVGAVRAALQRLSERDRRLLLLRHEGFRYREIANALQLAPGSVGTMLVRATAAFRQAYHELFDASA